MFGRGPVDFPPVPEFKVQRMTGRDDPDPGYLLVLAKAGNGPALGQLLERYGNHLSLLIRLQLGRRLRGKVDVEDLLQETFLGAYRGIALFRGSTERELLAWLRQILAGTLANAVRHHYGTQSRDPRLERERADDLDRSSRALDRGLISPVSSPSHQASRREQAVLLSDALQKLPEDYREVIILRQLEDMSFPEVAHRMGRSEDSVKNLWARALSRLRVVVEDPR
jgi:RNA polymerase sigma-70 factor, ECF subfamily